MNVDIFNSLYVCPSRNHMLNIISIDSKIKVLIIENSENFKHKNQILSQFNNVEVLCTGKNLGYGCANNYGMSFVKTDYVLILNPDVILDKATINEIIIASKKIESFAHSEFIKPEFVNIRNIKKNINDKKDLFGRPFKFIKVKDDKKLPKYLVLNKKKYRGLLT